MPTEHPERGSFSKRLGPLNVGSTETWGRGAPTADEPLGSLYYRGEGGSGTSLYVKEAAGAGGWRAINTASSALQGGNLVDGNVIAPHNPNLLSAAGAGVSANDARAWRAIMPRDGVLHDLAIWVVSGGGSNNVDVGVYDTTAGTANRLYSSGSVTTPANSAVSGLTSGWRIIGDPNLTVKAGDHLDIAFACDNATPAFARTAATIGASMVQLPAGFMVSPLGALPKIAWRAPSSFPLPTTIIEGDGSSTGKIPTGSVQVFVMARLA